MKPVNSLIRILCGVIDAMIVMLPIQLVVIGIFGIDFKQADVLFTISFAVYSALFTEYFNGMTLGKYFGKIRVVDKVSGKPPLLSLGLRELTKAIYFIPVVGYIIGAISVLMILKDGRALHDYVGNTRVIYIWQKESDLNEHGI